MEVADELEEVQLLLDDDGLVPVLKQVAGSLVPTIEGPGVPGEEGAHAPGQGAGARPDQEMEMVGQEGPCVDSWPPGLDQARQPAHEIIPIPVVPENRLPIETPGHHMVEDARGIETRAAWHGITECIKR